MVMTRIHFALSCCCRLDGRHAGVSAGEVEVLH